MAKRTLNIDVQVNGGGAIAQLAAVKGAIDSIEGKTVTVTVNTRHINSATKAVDGLADALDRLPQGIGGGLDRDVDRARRSLGRLGGDLGDVDRNMVRSRASSRELGESHRGLERASRRASGGVGGLGRSARDTDRGLGGLGSTIGGVGRGLGGLGRGAGGAGRMLAEVGDSAFDAGMGMAKAQGMIGNLTSGLTIFGASAAISAAGAGILTGAVGALGAVGVASLGAVGVAAGVAGGAMGAFAIDAHKDSARFGQTLEQMGKQAHLASQAISEPMAEAMVGLGRAMVGADNVMTPAGASIVSSLRAGFGEAAGVVNRSSGAIVDAADTAARGFARLTGEAAPGAAAFLSQLPALTQGAVSGMSQITSEFGKSAGAIEAATPAMNRAMGSAGALGAELVRIGRSNLAPFAEDVSSMTDGLTGMASNLAPAVRPAMTAVTDTVNAASGGIGSLAPDITDFAKTLSANAPELESIVGSLGRGILSFGGAAVDGLGMAAPAIADMAQSISANRPALTSMVAGLVGGAADVIGFGADAIGVGEKIDNAVKSVLPSGGFGKALAGDRNAGPGGGPGQALADAVRGPGGISPLSAAPQGGFRPNAGMIGDSKLAQWFNKTYGLKSGGPQSTRGAGGPGFFGAGGTFERISNAPDGLAGEASRGLFAPEGSTGALRAAFGGAAGRPPAPAGTNAPIAAGGGQQLISQMAAIPQGVAQAHTALNTLPTATQSAMAGTQQAVQRAGAPMGAAMTKNVQTMTRSISAGAPAAEAGGEAMGAAATGGMGKGITVTQTNTLTVIKKWIKKVIDTGMGALDAHSPSRKFKRIGTYIPMGVSEGIAERGRDAMNATSDMFHQQQAEGDRYRATMQSSSIIRIPAGKGRTPDDSGDRPGPGGSLDAAMRQAREAASAKYGGPYQNTRDAKGVWSPATENEGKYFGALHRADQDLMGRGAAKEAFFSGTGSATPNPDTKGGWDFGGPLGPRPTGTGEGDWVRSVFDKKTFGWEAKPGVDITKAKSMAELNSMIQSPLDSKTYGAMMAMQQNLDAGANANMQMFGERTQQNILRGRPGALSVADAWGDQLAKQKNAAEAAGRDTTAGFGKGIKENEAAAVDPMGNVTRRQKKKYTDDWEINSPSAVAAGYSADVVAGFGLGLTANAGVAAGAMGDVTGAVAGVASDGGLKIGYTWGTSFVDGVARMVQRNLLQVAAPPSIESPAAKAALARMGLWGPAGGGASVWKTPMVSMGGGPGSLTNNLDLRVYLGDELVMSRTALQTEQQIGEAFEEFASTFVVQ